MKKNSTSKGLPLVIFALLISLIHLSAVAQTKFESKATDEHFISNESINMVPDSTGTRNRNDSQNINETQENEEEIVKNIFQGTRFVNAQSANLVEKGKLNLAIQHRFGDISGGLYEFFGLDLASMRLGFEYGFGDNFNLGVGRSTFLKTYDGFAKFRFVQQSNNFPLTITATAEGAIPTQKNYFPESNNNFSDKFSGIIQLQLAKTINNLGLQISPGFLNTGYLISENTNYSMFITGFGGSVKLSKKVSVNLEYLYNFNNNYSNTKPLSVGVDLDTGGHLFQLIVSNSQQMFGQSLYTNTNGDWGKGQLYFGFNLIRQFRIKYYTNGTEGFY